MPKVIKRLLALALWCPATDGKGWDASRVEDSGHVIGVSDAHAEPERPHRSNIRHLVTHLFQHDQRSGVVAGEDIRQLLLVVASLGPADAAQIGAICHSKVVKGAEEIRAQGIPEPQLSCSTTSKELADVDAVGSFGGGGQAEQL